MQLVYIEGSINLVKAFTKGLPRVYQGIYQGVYQVKAFILKASYGLEGIVIGISPNNHLQDALFKVEGWSDVQTVASRAHDQVSLAARAHI